MGVRAGYASGQAATRSGLRDRRPRKTGAAAPRSRPDPQPDLRPQPDLQPQPDLRPQFRLRPGQDDTLIEWLTSLSPRRRSAAIREALYQHLATRQGEGSSGEWSEDPDLAAALDALF
jgi:hypothetical protein